MSSDLLNKLKRKWRKPVTKKDKIKLLTDDMIQLGTMKVTHKNKMLDITNSVISFAVSGNRVSKIDVEDYCKLNL